MTVIDVYAVQIRQSYTYMPCHGRSSPSSPASRLQLKRAGGVGLGGGAGHTGEQWQARHDRAWRPARAAPDLGVRSLGRQGAGCRVQGAGCRVQGAGCRVERRTSILPSDRDRPATAAALPDLLPGMVFSIDTRPRRKYRYYYRYQRHKYRH